jgi:hypothetical protein
VIARPSYRSKDLALINDLYRSMGMASEEASLERFLPLSDTAYVVLLALATPGTSDREFLAALERSVRDRAPTRGTLLAQLDRLVELGLVAAETGTGEQRHRVTGLGTVVLSVESGRRSRRFDVPTMPTLRTLAPTRPSFS